MPCCDLIVEEPAWLDALPELEAVADAAARAALAAASLDPDRHGFALLACDDSRIAALNGSFRDRPTPTNVLSWPAFELAAQIPGGIPKSPPGNAEFLGDVAIALGVVGREAAMHGISLKSHAGHLILHGCLHCLGYDHEDDADARLMETTESRLLAQLGIADPYLETPAAAAARHR